MANNSRKDYLTFTNGEHCSIFTMLNILLLNITVPFFNARSFAPSIVDAVLQKQLDLALGKIQENS
jgi:hypothetical protein